MALWVVVHASVALMSGCAVKCAVKPHFFEYQFFPIHVLPNLKYYVVDFSVFDSRFLSELNAPLFFS